VTFVDPLDAVGYVGASGQRSVGASAKDVETPYPAAGTLGGLQVTVQRNGKVAGPVVLTLVVDHLGTVASSTVTCSLAAIGSAAATTVQSCGDAVHTVTVVAGDALSLKVAGDGANFLRRLSWSVQAA
jgi:hypothetical protein